MVIVESYLNDAARYNVLLVNFVSNYSDLAQKQQQQQQLAPTHTNNTNEDIIKEYFDSMQIEINPSFNYVKTNRNTLNKLLQFHHNKPLVSIKRELVLQRQFGLYHSLKYLRLYQYPFRFVIFYFQQLDDIRTSIGNSPFY
jgi:hypothetical protein